MYLHTCVCVCVCAMVREKQAAVRQSELRAEQQRMYLSILCTRICVWVTRICVCVYTHVCVCDDGPGEGGGGAPIRVTGGETEEVSMHPSI